MYIKETIKITSEEGVKIALKGIKIALDLIDRGKFEESRFPSPEQYKFKEFLDEILKLKDSDLSKKTNVIESLVNKKLCSDKKEDRLPYYLDFNDILIHINSLYQERLPILSEKDTTFVVKRVRLFISGLKHVDRFKREHFTIDDNPKFFEFLRKIDFVDKVSVEDFDSMIISFPQIKSSRCLGDVISGLNALLRNVVFLEPSFLEGEMHIWKSLREFLLEKEETSKPPQTVYTYEQLLKREENNDHRVIKEALFLNTKSKLPLSEV